jgi:hypothetical protein
MIETNLCLSIYIDISYVNISCFGKSNEKSYLYREVMPETAAMAATMTTAMFGNKHEVML